MAKDEDYYALLGVRPDASEIEIRRAYRQRVLMFHPDRRPGDAAAEARFKQIAEAYSVLGARDRRSRYDATRVNEDVVSMAQAAKQRAPAPKPLRQEIRPTPRAQRFAGGEEATALQLTGTLRTGDALFAVVVAAALWETSRLLLANVAGPHWISAAAEVVAALAIGFVAFRIAVAADDNARYPLLAPAGAALAVGSALVAAAVAAVGFRGPGDGSWFVVAAACAAVGATVGRSVGRAFLAEAASASGSLFARGVSAVTGGVVAAATAAIPLGLAALAAFVSEVSDGMLHAGLVATGAATLCGALVTRDAR